MKNRFWRVDQIQSYLTGGSYAESCCSPLCHPLRAERIWQIWCEIVFVSICHQTNWDGLHQQVISIAQEQPDLISPEGLAEMSKDDFVQHFGPGIDGKRMMAKERVAILRSLASSVGAWPNDTIACLTDRRIQLEGEHGLYAWLLKIAAFSEDPLRKKARVLVHQLLRYELIEVVDKENILPAIDYHIVRLYARTGRVYPVSENELDKMAEEYTARVEFHNHLRSAVEEAMWYTLAGSGLRMDHLNHLEWQIARSYCTRHEARCQSGPLESKPVDTTVLSLAATGFDCPLYESCLGAHNDRLRKIRDPRTARSFY